jgi:hypothetical protein
LSMTARGRLSRAAGWPQSPVPDLMARPYTAPRIFGMASRPTDGSPEMLLFVYGTLRRDAANHRELRDATFIGRARTQPKYELVDMGGYPALLEGGADAVVGEVPSSTNAKTSRSITCRAPRPGSACSVRPSRLT